MRSFAIELPGIGEPETLRTVWHRFPLTDAAAALRFTEQGGKTGKVALVA